MSKVRLLLLAEAAGWKNKKHIGWFLVLIIMMIGTFSYAGSRKQDEVFSGKIVLGVANEDESEYAGLLLQYFNENEEFLHYVELIEKSEEELHKALQEGGLDAYLSIPAGFAQSMLRMENQPIKAAVSMKNPTKALVLRHVMEAYETYIEAVEASCTALYRRMKEEGFTVEERNAANVEISMELIFTALGKDEFFRRRVLEETGKQTVPLMEHYFHTAVYFVMLFCFLPAGLKVIAQKKNGLFFRLRVMNVSGAAQFIAVGLPYLLMSAAALALLCYGRGNMARYLPCLALVIFWIPVLIFLGCVCNNSRNYIFICSMLLIVLAVLGGSLVPEAYLPEQFIRLANGLPNYWFVRLMAGF